MSMFHELMMRKKEEIMYATIKGTLTENDGVFSGFSANNYLKTSNNIIINQSSDFEIVVKINISVFADLSAFIGTYGYYGIDVRTGVDYKIHCSIGNGSSWLVSNLATNSTFSVNTDYFFKLTIKNGVITVFSSLDGNSWIEEGTTTVTLSEINTPINLGIGRINTTYFNGTIDLNNSYIKLGSTKYNLQAVVGWTKVGSPTITDGVVSGFVDRVNYLSIPQLTVEQIGTNSEFICKFNSQNNFFPLFSMGTNQGLWIYLRSDHKIRVKIGNATQHDFVVSNDIDLTQDHICKVIFKNYSCSVYLDGNLIETFLFETPTNTTYSGEFRIGGEAWVQSSGYAFTGCTIDLNYTQVKENNKLYFNGQPSA